MTGKPSTSCSLGISGPVRGKRRINFILVLRDFVVASVSSSRKHRQPNQIRTAFPLTIARIHAPAFALRTASKTKPANLGLVLQDGFDVDRLGGVVYGYEPCEPEDEP